MIYILKFDRWVKVGFTKQDWTSRAAKGFWNNKHPPELCGKLDQYTIIAAFEEDDIVMEQIIHKDLLQGGVGEFYKEEALPDILALLRNLLHETRAAQAYRSRPKEMRPCCSGCAFVCHICCKSFSRNDKLRNHMLKCGK